MIASMSTYTITISLNPQINIDEIIENLSDIILKQKIYKDNISITIKDNKCIIEFRDIVHSNVYEGTATPRYKSFKDLISNELGDEIEYDFKASSIDNKGKIIPNV